MSAMIGNSLLLGGEGGYQISRSVRLRASASAYFNRTPASTTNRRTWTWSAWAKRGSLGAYQGLFGAGIVAGSAYDTVLRFGSGDTLDFFIENASSGYFVTTQVFRDPSAWYHIVLAFDTTQATASNRVKLYVNGLQVTSFSTANYPTQNLSAVINQVSARHALGAQENVLSQLYYFDGYLTEINFIDGQALTPSSFGETDAVTGVWKPKKYAGTYGTNGFYLPFNINTTSSYGASFNGSSQYLSATVGTSTIGSGDFTIEFWINSTSATDARMFSLGNNNATGSLHIIYTGTYMRVNYATTTGATGTKQVSGGGWHHYALVRSSNTLKSYVDGVLDVNYGTVTDNFNLTALQIGANTALPSYFSGTLSNFRITTTAVYTSNFTPATAPLTAITGTTLLTLQNATFVDNSTNAYTLTNNGSMSSTTQYPFTLNVSADASGNGNNWTPNNISMVVGVTYDSMLDVPTQWADGGNGRGNYATLASNAPGIGTITEANLKNASGTTTVYSAISTISVDSGKWYWEVTATAINTTNQYPFIGAYRGIPNTLTGAVRPGGDVNGFSFRQNGPFYVDGVNTQTISSFTTNDVIGVALDLTNLQVQIYKNGTLVLTQTGLTAGTYTPADSEYNGSNVIYNFGQRPFSYTPPTGFKALNTLNLPTPTILKGNQYFDATTYTGTGASQSITNTGSMQPDLVWVKGRSGATDHALYDSVRGVQKQLESNTTTAETTETTGLTAFNSNGFTVGALAQMNTNTATYVGWQWKEGATQGFDIVTYTGTGATRTVAHSLGVAPSMIIFKEQSGGASSGVNDWGVYHVSTGNTGQMRLNLTAAFVTNSTCFNNTSPTSSVFTVGSQQNYNESGGAYVAYLFAEVAGFSKFGSYTGNGSADGAFVFCGFRPRYVLIKCSSAAGTGWYVYDTARNTYNVMDLYLRPDVSDAETSFTAIDCLSNGFKIRTSNSQFNGSGSTYIYAAFAENPFKNALAR